MTTNQNLPQTPTNTQENLKLAAKNYAIIAVVGLIFTSIFLLTFLHYLDLIFKHDIGEWFFYILLVLLGTSISTFLFGTMNSVATYKGHVL